MNDLRLRQLPVSARILLTAFLLIVGAGYGLGIANIYYSHRSADGDERLSLDDLKAVYSGLQVEVTEDRPLPSRMLEMIDGKMREFLDDASEYEALRNWLTAGSKPEAFTVPAPPAGKSPQEIISDNCIRCHNPEGEKGEEEARKSPFAADLFGPADLEMVSRHTVAEIDEKTGVVTTGPQSIERLVLIGHVHMLSIPVFTLITSLLTLFTGFRPWVRGILVAGPMTILLLDFAGWWLSRQWTWAIWAIAVSGVVYGVLFGAQILLTLLSMWFGRRAR